MQIRKLVKSGNSSLVVAIPRDWIKSNKLNAGDLVYINENSNKLNIKCEKPTEEKANKNNESVINIDKLNKVTIRREITCAYLDNYDIIIIKGNELKSQTKFVKKIIGEFVALELIEESFERIVAKSFLDMKTIDLKVLVRRVDNIVRSMITDTKNVIDEADIIDAIVDRDNEVNRLNFLISKIIKSAYTNKSILNSLNLEEVDVLRYWELNGHLEKIGDRTKNIAESASKIKKEHKKVFLDLFEDLEELYKTVMTSFYKNSIKLSDEVYNKRKKILPKIDKYIIANNCQISALIGINAYNMSANINDIGRIIRYIS